MFQLHFLSESRQDANSEVLLHDGETEIFSAEACGFIHCSDL